MEFRLFWKIAIGLILLVSACTSVPITGTDSSTTDTQTTTGTGLLPACGNGVVELGEQCDQSACTGGSLCTADCKCESLTPPALPEE